VIHQKVVPCHLIFQGEEVDIEKIRNLIGLLNATQMIEKIKIVDGHSEKEIAECRNLWRQPIW